MEIEKPRIETADGYRLAATLYRVPGAETAVLINPAMAVKRAYYDLFARYLAERGLTVLCFDYRGIGGSRPDDLRRSPARLADWGRYDIAAALAWLRREIAPKRLTVLGHSMGGQLLGMVPPADDPPLAGILLVAAQHSDWRLWPRPGAYALYLFWSLLIPAACRLWGYFPGRRFGLFEDLPTGVAREWARWSRPPKASGAYMTDPDGTPLHQGFTETTAPIRALSFSDDPYAPKKAVAALLALYEKAPTEHRHIEPTDIGHNKIGHFGCFRSAVKDELWAPAAGWLAGA